MEPLQEKIAKAIVNIFETGHLLGNYASVVNAPNDPGHLTYGRSQASLASGSLSILIEKYCAAPGATFAAQLQPYLDRLRARDVTLDQDADLRQLLVQAGADPTMRQTQDAFFDEAYWQPAQRRATAAGVTLPLGVATVYDSTVHGSYPAIRSATDAVLPPPRDERDWVRRYIAVRRAWLANNANPILQRCVYRMDELQRLVDVGNWALDPPMTVRSITMTQASFGDTAPDAEGVEPVRASAHDSVEVALRVQVPYVTGPAVALVQHALVREGLLPESAVDGVYGPLTAELVKHFQLAHGLAADGVVGPATWAVIRQ